MIARLSRLASALLTPFALASCLLAPGKFVSSLRINADRIFTFTYVGEVIAVDMSNDLTKGFGDTPSGDKVDPTSDGGDGPPVPQKLAFQAGDKTGDKESAAETAAKKAEADRKNKAIAEALSKEAGYRKVALSRRRQVHASTIRSSGTLDHSFVYPYNLDAEIVFPFIAVEVRANGTVRVKAPGFAADSNDGRACRAREQGDRASSTAPSRSTPTPRSSARTMKTAR